MSAEHPPADLPATGDAGTEHVLDGPTGRKACSCGWKLPLGANVYRAFDRHLLAISAAESSPEDARRRTCLAVWPEAQRGAYNPACCRFPKSCSIEPAAATTVRRLDAYTIAIDGTRIPATREQEDRIRALSPSEQQRLAAIFGGDHLVPEPGSALVQVPLAEPADDDGPGEGAELRRCRGCGCTDERACSPPCWWVEADLCSACREGGDDA